MKSVLFDLGNPVFKFLSTLLDLCILNILFVITSLPIFTIGAALTSVHYVMITGWDTQNMRLFAMYFKSFKENFKQSTIVWLLMVIIGAVFGYTGYLVYLQSKIDDSVLFMAFVVIFAIICFAYLCVMTYVWPIIAKFENDTKTTLKNALILAISHLPSTLVVWFMFAIAAYFIAINMLIRAFALFILLGVLFYFQTRVFRSVFAPYLEQETKRTRDDSEDATEESDSEDAIQEDGEKTDSNEEVQGEQAKEEAAEEEETEQDED